MKITKTAQEPVGLRIEETAVGEVYFYKPFEVYVIRTSHPERAYGFVGLSDGDYYFGQNNEMFPVDAELVIR